MTPEQQAALESVAARALSAADIAQIAPLLADRHDVEIAAILSAGRVKVQSKQIGIGTILMALGENGGDFLDELVALGQTNRNVFWSLELIKAGTFDIGLDGTRAQLQALSAGIPVVAPALAALMATAETPDPIESRLVSDALNVAEGRMVL